MLCPIKKRDRNLSCVTPSPVNGFSCSLLQPLPFLPLLSHSVHTHTPLPLPFSLEVCSLSLSPPPPPNQQPQLSKLSELDNSFNSRLFQNGSLVSLSVHISSNNLPISFAPVCIKLGCSPPALSICLTLIPQPTPFLFFLCILPSC